MPLKVPLRLPLSLVAWAFLRAASRRSVAPLRLSLRGVTAGQHRLTVVVSFGRTSGFKPLVATQ